MGTLAQRQEALDKLVDAFVSSIEIRDLIDMVDDRVLLGLWLQIHRRCLQLSNGEGK